MASESEQSIAIRLRLSNELHKRSVRITNLSEAIGRHRDYVSNILTGKAKPAADVYFQIAQEVGFDPSLIFQDQSEEQPETVEALENHLKSLIDDLQDFDYIRNHYDREVDEERRARDTSAFKVPKNGGPVNGSRMSAFAHATLSRLSPKGYVLQAGLPWSPKTLPYINRWDKWSEEYVRDNLGAKDPVLSYMINHRGYASWQTIAEASEDRTVFLRAAAHGRHNGSVITECHCGEKIAVSLVHPDDQVDLTEDQKEDVRSSLLIILSLLQGSRRRLSAEEKLHHNASRYLWLTSQGLTDDYTLKHYGISPRLKKALKSEVSKLFGARSVEEAIVRGIDTGVV